MALYHVCNGYSLPGSETALEELMCRVMGDFLQESSVAKLADDLLWGKYPRRTAFKGRFL